MAKKSLMERKQEADAHGGALPGPRGALKAVADDESRLAGGAVCGAHRAGGVAAEFIGDARPAALHVDRAAARQLPEIRAVADRASGAGVVGQIPGMVKSSW